MYKQIKTTLQNELKESKHVHNKYYCDMDNMIHFYVRLNPCRNEMLLIDGAQGGIVYDCMKTSTKIRSQIEILIIVLNMGSWTVFDLFITTQHLISDTQRAVVWDRFPASPFFNETQSCVICAAIRNRFTPLCPKDGIKLHLLWIHWSKSITWDESNWDSITPKNNLND